MVSSQARHTLQQIIESQHYDKHKHQNWSELKHEIVDVINQLVSRFESCPDIKEKGSRIIDNLDSNFEEAPPFTVPRLAEVILDPAKEGYRLDTETGVKKYMNTLVRITFVSSTIEDFPRPTFAGEEKPNDDDIPLVKIPWLSDLKESKRDKEDSDDERQAKRARSQKEKSEKSSGDDSSDDMEMDTSIEDKAVDSNEANVADVGTSVDS